MAAVLYQRLDRAIYGRARPWDKEKEVYKLSSFRRIYNRIEGTSREEASLGKIHWFVYIFRYRELVYTE